MALRCKTRPRSAFAGQQFEHGFAEIGNRQTAAHGGNVGVATRLPQAPETYLHDTDGELTHHGLRTNQWNVKNAEAIAKLEWITTGLMKQSRKLK